MVPHPIMARPEQAALSSSDGNPVTIISARLFGIGHSPLVLDLIMATPATHVWRPSSSRIVRIDSFVAVPRGSAAVAPPPLNWPAKDPADVLDYRLDIAPAIMGNDGDVISTIDTTISPSNPGDLLLDRVTADASTAIFWLSGGQAGTIYALTVLIGTLNGRSVQRSILLPVLTLSTPAVPANSLITASGLVLTDQNGNPVMIAP